MPESRSFWNPERETMPIKELKELQNEKLRYQVAHGYHNAPIIRELWDGKNISPDDIKTTEDLTKAPIFRKEDARQRQIERGDTFGGRLAQPMSNITEESGAIISTSSGTTGTPTNYIVSEHDREIAAECFARHHWGMGLREGDTMLNLTIPNHVGFDSYADAAQKIGANVVNVNHHPDEIYRIAHVLEYVKPTVVKLFSPPIVQAMEEYMVENDIDAKELWEPVESLGYAGEPLVPGERERIEQMWGVEVFENVGGLEPHWYPTERENHNRWCHVNDDHFYIEAIDPQTQERVDEGERGELLVTALSYTAMSHIRWAHDDIVEIKRGESEFGRTHTRVKFLGRVGDLIRVRGEKLLPWDVWLVVEDIEEMSGNLFQFFEDSENSLKLRIGYNEDRTSDPQDLARDVEARVEEELDVPVEVVDTMTESEISEMGPPHKIPRITSE